MIVEKPQPDRQLPRLWFFVVFFSLNLLFRLTAVTGKQYNNGIHYIKVAGWELL